MYSCSSGTSLVKPASTRSPAASQAIASVMMRNAASTRLRCENSARSSRAVTGDVLGVEEASVICESLFGPGQALGPELSQEQQPAV